MKSKGSWFGTGCLPGRNIQKSKSNWKTWKQMTADAKSAVKDDLGETMQKIEHEDKDMAERQTWKLGGMVPEVMLKQQEF